MAESDNDISRRGLVAAGAGFVPVSALLAQRTASPPALARAVNHALTARQLQTLHAFLDRLCPTDEMGPGATDMGAAEFIDRALGDWLAAELPSFTDSLGAVDAFARRSHGGDFHTLAIESQDAVIAAMEAGTAQGFANSRNVFARMRQLMLQGMFSDPKHGGNRNFAGWDLIGYPGAVLGAAPNMQTMGERLKPVHRSAYDAPAANNEHDGH